ncbi:non-ribosomal peptide synthetase [Marinobacter sp. SS21]|uniref:non-ribosomal peptide synthetase n=1 Tax=Marinobacter sp. SS21 TaxID=2979460 RepID=UPI00232E1EF5|nr:amino acid adenylation domain-containing protein [Marinobacter sp. SS21]MDC0662364.1 amino acid adenylation domain-containing protein [Marinobacter sp. SS21]
MKAIADDAWPALTPLQRAYWIGGREDFDLHVYPHLYLEFDVATIDPLRLERALAGLIHRHPLLRATVSDDGGLQLAEAVTASVTVHNLTGASQELVEVSLDRMRDQLRRRQFHPEHAPRMQLDVSLATTVCRVHICLDLMLFDGSAVRLLLADLSRLYQHPDADGDTPAPPPANAVTKSSTQHRERCRQYWLRRLDKMPDAPALPLRSHDGQPRRSLLTRRRAYLSPDKWRSLESQASDLGVSPATVLLTAYSLVVAGYSRIPHFYLTMMKQGTGTSERSPAAQNLASTLLVEFDYRQRRSFKDYLLQVHARILRDMTRSAICGLEVLTERNRLDQSTARAASPVAFVAMLDPVDPQLSGLFQLEGRNMVFSALETPQVVLDHQAIRGEDGGVALIWDVMETAFEDGVLDAMFNAYIDLIHRLADAPDTWLTAGFDLRPPAQRLNHRIYNDSARQLRTGQLLQDYVGECPAHLVNKTAVIDGDRTLSYGELRRLSNRLAWTLKQEFEVGPGALVAVDLAKGWRQAVAVQAILAVGAAYVPLGHHLPNARKQAVLDQCAPAVVIRDGHQPELSWRTLEMNQPEHWSICEDNLPRVQTAADTAYIIFTSGSTGTPKGVALDHHGPVNTIEDINRRFGITSQDVVFGLSDLNFDLSVYDLFGTFAAGATLVIPPQGAGRDPALCEGLIRQYGVTLWNSVPALAQLFLDHLERNRPDTPLPLRRMMLSGDWLPVQLPQRMARFGPVSITSLGGATEASIWSIYFDIGTVEPHWPSIPYGFPLANQTIHVLDASLQPRPDQVPGELFIGGQGVAQGYWQAPERTRQAFITHPDNGERLYRTGDWGVRRPQGHIEFLGRQDGQVKIRGYRIELGDIESQLQRHPQVTGAVVRVTGSNAENTALAAYVVCESEPFDSDQLLSWLRTQLPEYMVPSYLLRLDTLPLSANGKVDRKALPDPSTRAVRKPFTPPQGDTEQGLAEIWQSVLDQAKVCRQDNFFALGGTSFSVVRVLAAVEDRFGVTLPMQSLLRHPELAALAAEIDRGRNSPSLQCGQVSARDSELENGLKNARESAMESAPETALVPLTKPTRDKATMVWFHPSGGNVFCYQALTAALADDFGAMGVQATTQPAHAALETMVSRYLAELAPAIATTPCILAGWSFGGVLAYQAALERLANGERVDGLILVDAPAPTGQPMPDDNTLIHWFLGDLAQTPTLPALQLGAHASPEARLAQGLRQLQQQGLIADTGNLSISRLYQLFAGNVAALQNYAPESLAHADFPCLIVQAGTPLEGRVSGQSGAFWASRLPPHARIVELQANHYSILQSPCLETLTQLIRSWRPVTPPTLPSTQGAPI